jgi:hypothetical protein
MALCNSAMDASNGDDGVNDPSIVRVTAIWNALAVSSITAGTVPQDGTLIPGDPGLFKPWRSPAAGARLAMVLAGMADPRIAISD